LKGDSANARGLPVNARSGGAGNPALWAILRILCGAAPPGPRGTPTSRFLCFVRSLRMLKRPTRGSAADRGSAPQSAEQSQS